uniref:Glycosyltransferase family 2 protein n=1 Tax=Cohnella candidum TaxID=2674991 RepID=A0A3G3JT79_9BACL|nr:glycosyltransferase family 2 protein [Cohnella candidum]
MDLPAISESSLKAQGRAAYRQGFEEGFRQGVRAGGQHYGILFEGTSIVIPTHNQLAHLKKCLESVEKHTESAYEILVVDNASADGTAEYLKSLRGRIRFCVLEENRGFSGAVNIGLMMAKGRTIVLLKPDTWVTGNWLQNLLVCLNSDARIGMVGPLSDTVGGAQRIRISNLKAEEKEAFAREHNRSRPTQWRDSDSLQSFCLLFRRELFEEIGYFDEGFESGKLHDLDYSIRVRLAGKRLVIARDTFVRHAGSENRAESENALTGQDPQDQSCFTTKWSDAIGWLQRAAIQAQEEREGLPAGTLFYPQRVVVQGVGDSVYWIEGGHRHLVRGSLSFPSVRLSQVDLRRWPVGDTIHAREVEVRWRGLDDPDGWGGVAQLSDGTVYYLEGSTVRRVVSTPAMHSWNLHLKPVQFVHKADLADRIAGLPIVSLPLLKQRL